MTNSSGGDPPGGDDRTPDRSVRDPVTVGAAALLSLGLLGVAGTALAGSGGPFAGVGLAAAAVGLAGVLYGLGQARSPAGRLTAAAGLVTALLAVGLSPLAVDANVALPGGVWALPYAAGVVLLVAGGVAIPAARSTGERRPGSEESEDGETAGDRPTGTVTRTDDGDWTWRLATAGGDPLARADRTYHTAAAARQAVGRLAEAFDAENPQTITEPGSREDRSTGDDAGEEPEPETGTGHASVDRIDTERADDGTLGGDETAAFEVREGETGWHWRLRYGEDTEIAAGAGPFDSADAARMAVDRVRTDAPDSGVLTYDPGTFEVYPAGDDWHWRLREGDGSVVARSPDAFESRGDAMSAIGALKEPGEAAPTVEAAGDGYRWRLADAPARAEGVENLDTEDDARAAFEAVHSLVPEAGVLVVAPAGFAVTERDGGTWGWRLRGPDGDVLAESPGHTNRDRAIEGLRTVQRVAPHAEVATVDDETAAAIEEALSDAAEARSMAERLPEAPDGDAGDVDGREDPMDEDRIEQGEDPETAVEVYEDDDWRWRLRHGGRTLGTETGFPSPETATDDARRIAAALETAVVVDPDPMALEVHPAGDDWSWRLVDRDGTVVARAPGEFDRADHAERAGTAALDRFGATPEIHRDDGWRWRLRGDDGLLAVGARGFGETDAAREHYGTVAAEAPGSPSVECETALELSGDDGEYGLRLRDRRGRAVGTGFGRFDDPGTASEVATAVVQGVAARDDPVETVDRSTDGAGTD